MYRFKAAALEAVDLARICRENENSDVVAVVVPHHSIYMLVKRATWEAGQQHRVKQPSCIRWTPSPHTALPCSDGIGWQYPDDAPLLPDGWVGFSTGTVDIEKLADLVAWAREVCAHTERGFRVEVHPL